MTRENGNYNAIAGIYLTKRLFWVDAVSQRLTDYAEPTGCPWFLGMNVVDEVLTQ